MARDRDELGRFVAAADEAAVRLQGFSREVEESTRASSDHARASKEAAEASEANVERLGSAGLLGAQGFTSASSTGDLDAGLAHLTQASIRAIKGTNIGGVPVGEIGAELSGLNRANNVLGAASASVGDVVGDLRRYNIDVSDEFIQDNLKVRIEQEERVEAARRKVSGAAYTAENMTAAGANETAAQLLTAVQEIAKALANLGGGSG